MCSVFPVYTRNYIIIGFHTGTRLHARFVDAFLCFRRIINDYYLILLENQLSLYCSIMIEYHGEVFNDIW